MRRSDLKRNIFSTVLITLTTVFASLASANDEIASNALIDRVGLTVDWFTHSGAGANGGLVDWHLNVNEDKATTFFTITAPGNYRETFSQNELDAFGKPYGIDGGVAYAELRKDVLKAEFENEGVKDPEIKITQYMLPQTSIYTLTSDGIVRSIDGDTGKQNWSTSVGLASLPSIGLGSNNNYVAAVNGSSVYCLEADTGKVLWSRKCRYAVGASPAVCDEKVFVPLTNGRLESFDIEDKGVNSLAFVEMGEGTARPVVTEKTVSWPNSRGNLNVAARYQGRSVAYQLRSDESIVCSPTYSKGKFFVTSLDGFIYSVDEDRGSVEWQVSTGRGISQSPVIFNDHVFVINNDQQLFKLHTENGMPANGWIKPRSDIRKYLGASQDKLYVLDRFSKLKVISQSTGAVLSSVNFGDVDKVLANDLTDRIYIASKRGMIQCIREQTRPIPYFHTYDFGPEEGKAPVMAEKADEDPAKLPPEVDPFNQGGGGADPFNTPAKDPVMDDDSNPFKSNDDAEKPADDGDPFAGNDAGSETPADTGAASNAAGKSEVEDDPFK